MIEIRERFDVQSNQDRVWAILSDPYEVVGCVPGASIVGENDDGTLDAQVVVKFGPTRITFRVLATVEMDEAARQGNVSAQGKDSIGGTKVRSTAQFGATPGPGGTGSTVIIDGHVEVSGRLAGLIEGGASRVVRRMSGEFAQRLAERCAQEAPSR